VLGEQRSRRHPCGKATRAEQLRDDEDPHGASLQQPERREL
jgi:hypothetical protein